MKTTKKIKQIYFLFTALCVTFLLQGCLSKELNAVKEPRSGNIISINNSDKKVESRAVVVYSYNYRISLYGLEKLHPFDILKYEKIYTGLVKDGVFKPEDVFVPEEISQEDILLIHTESFIQSLKNPKSVATYLEAPQMAMLPSFIVNRKIITPFKRSTGGTLLAAEQALNCGIAINIGGGYHHAKPEAGEGFCLFADIPIAIRKLQKEGKIKKALIVDLDVHQGNGTIVSLGEKDDSTFTFSMHEGDIYPFPKEKGDLDIELQAGDSDLEVMEKLESVINQVFDKSSPDIVFYLAGCDMLQGDPLANLAMTENGIVKRDQRIIDECIKRQIPVVMLLGGGYSKNAWHAQYLSIKNILTASQ